MSDRQTVHAQIRNVFERELGIEFLPEERAELEEFSKAVNHRENIIIGYVHQLDDHQVILRPSLFSLNKSIICVLGRELEPPPNNAKIKADGKWKRIPYLEKNEYKSSDVFQIFSWTILPRPIVELPLSYEEVLSFFVDDMGIEFKDPYLANRLLYHDALLANAISAAPIPERMIGGLFSTVSYLNNYKTLAQRALSRIRRMVPSTQLRKRMGMRSVEFHYYKLMDVRKIREQKSLLTRRTRLLSLEPLSEISASFHLHEAKIEKFASKKFYGDINFLLPPTLQVRKNLPTEEKLLFEYSSLFSDKAVLPATLHIPLFFIATHINMPIIEHATIKSEERLVSRELEKITSEIPSVLIGKNKLIDPSRLSEQAIRTASYLSRRVHSQKTDEKTVRAALAQIFELSNKFIEDLSLHEKMGTPKLSSMQATILKAIERLSPNNEPINKKEVIQELEKKRFSRVELEQEIEKMLNMGLIYVPAPGKIRIVR